MVANVGFNRPAYVPTPAPASVCDPFDQPKNNSAAIPSQPPRQVTPPSTPLAAARCNIGPLRSTSANVLFVLTDAVVHGIAWLLSPIAWIYCSLAAILFRYGGYQNAAALDADLERSEQEVERRHESYLAEPRSETTWLPYGVNLSSRGRGLRRQEAYLYSHVGRLLIPETSVREALLDRTQTLREKFTRYHDETRRAVIDGWRRSFDEELERVRTGGFTQEEARQTLQRLDASIAAAKCSVGTKQKPQFYARVEQVRRQLQINAAV